MIVRCAARVLLAAIAVCTLGMRVSHAQTVGLQEVYDRYRTALVRIEVFGTNSAGIPVNVRQGSGIIVRSNGKILTALHNVGAATEWQKNPDGSLNRTISISRFDDNNLEQKLGSASVTEFADLDVALLHTNALGLPTVPIDQNPLPPFSKISAFPMDPGFGIGKPLEGQLTATNMVRDGPVYTVVMRVIPGYSGAPIFGQNGYLAGIIVRQYDNDRALAVPSDLILPRYPFGSNQTAQAPRNPEPLVKTFIHPNVSKDGNMLDIRITIIQTDAQPAKYILEYTWTGSGGTWRGSQNVTVFLKGPGGATLQTDTHPIDRGGCYYGGGVRQTREKSLTISPLLVTGFEVTLSEASGGTPC
jgi:hypothetical protein